jgi:hypothetical protein
MISISFEPILPPGNYFGHRADALQAALVAALQSDVTTTLVGALRQRSANWSVSPLWSSEISSGGNIVLTLKPSGPGAKLWTWVSAGTRPHSIDPRRRKVMSFNSNPGRKTGPAGTGRFGMTRAPSGEDVFAHHVDHPGIEARAFEVDVVDDKGDKVIAILEAAVAAAIA